MHKDNLFHYFCHVRKTILSIICVMFFIPAFGQGRDTAYMMQYVVDERGDTLFIDELPPAYKYVKPPRGKKGKKWREYYKLVHNFAKAYPYALLAAEKLSEADEHLEGGRMNKRKKTRYINEFQDDLFETFEEPMRNLTVTQGALLLRLIDRETGLTPYQILQKYKNNASAGFWQGIARLFGSDMKRGYDPEGSDKDVEELVQIYRCGEFNYLYVSIFGKRPPEPVQRAAGDYPQRYGF